MDTMLGLDNTGVYRFKYFDEDTDSSIFNGEEILWNFVRDALEEELSPWYSELENALLTADKMLPYFNSNQANMANEAMYNGDAAYKYIDPAREGYYDHLNGKTIAPGAAPYLYAAQGDRSLMREWFLTNRMKFLRGKYNSSKYQSGDRIEFRWYYPTGTEQDELLRESIKAVPPDGNFKFTSLKTGYAGVKLGANGNVYSERFDDAETKTINLSEASSANGTEAYLLGLSNLTDLGDLSNKYMQKFIIAKEDVDVRLKDLTLGNPHKDYHNPYWKPGDAQSQAISLIGCTYLETFNLQNCASYNNTLDFTPCPAIKKILLTGSRVGNVSLPINGMLEELRLPPTVKTVKIQSHSNLTEDKFSIGTYDYGSASKIGEGVGYVNDYSSITELYIVDTPINTYDIITTEKGSLTGYYLQNTSWHITAANEMYCMISSDYYNENPTEPYYRKEINGEYSVYTGSYYPADRNIYRLVKMLDNDNNIICIPALEYLQTKQILNGTNHGEALSGAIFVDVPLVNGQKTKVDELYLYEKYKDIYPNISFTYGSNVNVAGALRINFYSIDSDSLGDKDLSTITPAASTLTAGAKASLLDIIHELNFVPIKTSTATHTYHFSGKWWDWNTKTDYYQDDAVANINGIPTNKLFSNVYPTADMHLVPEFVASERIYTINFYDYNYSFGVPPIFTVQSKFENKVGDIVTDARFKYMFRNDDATLGEHERYTFKGWQSESDFKNNDNLTDVASVIVRSDLNYYAYYEPEDATLCASDLELFDIAVESVKVSSLLGSGNAANKRGYRIKVKDKYVNLLGGKITLPSKDKDGNDIQIIGQFQNVPNITKIYFLDDAKYESVCSGAFTQHAKLDAIYLPNSIRIIGDSAFKEAFNLVDITLNNDIEVIGSEAFSGTVTKSLKVSINELPTNLKAIGSNCLRYAGQDVYISVLPDNIYNIPSGCFGNCPNVTVNEFPARDKACSIGSQAFFRCGASANITTINIESPWTIEEPSSAQYGSFGSDGQGYMYVTTVTVYSGLANGDLDALEKKMFGALRDTVTIVEVQ